MRHASALALASVIPLLVGVAAPATAFGQNLEALVATTSTGAPANEDTSLAAAPTQQATDRMVVKFSDDTSATQREEVLEQAITDTKIAPVDLLEEVGETGAGGTVMQLDAEVTADDAAALADELAEDPGIEWAAPDALMSTTATTPNDTDYAKQWAMNAMDMPAVWEKATGKGVVIGVVDTGSLAHRDLDAGHAGGYDFVSSLEAAGDGNGRDSDPSDPGTGAEAGVCTTGAEHKSSWHGAHVAGIAAATKDNGVWIAGMAPEAQVLSARAVGSCDKGYTSDIADAIRWLSGAPVPGVPAAAKPASVINLSLGYYGRCLPVMQEAISTAVSRGVTVIASAGNAGVDASAHSPGNCSNVITVGSTAPSGSLSTFSNRGSTLDLVAPGDAIYSTVSTGTRGPGEDFAVHMSGTSQAAPQVAGLVALLKQQHPSMTPTQIQEKLTATATTVSGGKLINPVKALGITTAPAPAPVPTTSPTPIPTPMPTPEQTTAPQPLPAPSPAPFPFTDVRPDQAFYNEIAWMASNGISGGWKLKDGTKVYRPSERILRDQMAAFMYRLAGSPEYTPPATSKFTDVRPGQAFYKEISWLAENGISNGWAGPNGTRQFRPGQPVLRDQMAAFMYRLAGSPEYTPPATSKFTDSRPGKVFYKEISWLAENGVSNGWAAAGGTRIYGPDRPVLRDQMAAFMYRLDQRDLVQKK